MKKQIRTIIIATVITCAIIISCAFAMPARAENRGEFYPKLTVVFETEKVGDLWVVYCIDKSQNIWSFYDDEGTWKNGDIANLLMRNMGECEEDDKIIEVYLEGHTENLEMFFHTTEWR